MGVHHLESFLNALRGGKIEISIEEECLRFQREKEMRPTLIIDAVGMSRAFAEKYKIWGLCGGRNQLIHEACEELLGQLSRFAELVLFEDGPAVQEKLRTLTQRHHDKYHTVSRIVKQIDEGKPWQDITEDLHFRSPLRWTKSFGKHFIAVTKDCDAEIARYANNDPTALAVLSDDTDFLIFPGTWRYFSLRNINLESLTTFEYSRKALRKDLGLNDIQMNILSTLAGNDIIRYEDLQAFHRKYRIYREEKFFVLAKYIKKKMPACRSLQHFAERTNLICFIAIDVLEDFREETIHRIDDSLEQYSIKFDEANYSVYDPVLYFCQVKKYNFCLKVLKNRGVRDKSDRKQYYEFFTDISKFTLELLRKQIGILLQHIRLDEYPEKYAPIYPDVEVPSLLEFLDREKHPEHDELRFKLLKWVISEEILAPHDLSFIPEKYLIHILTLVFMTTHGFITVPEADLILWTIRQVELELVPAELEPPLVLDSRAFRISIKFNELAKHQLRSLQVTGLANSKMKVSNFDGVFFHIKYLELKSSGFLPVGHLADLQLFRLYRSVADKLPSECVPSVAALN